MSSYISTLRLHHFRCYETAEMQSLSGGFVVLYGPNGAGKTNILEGVSMLSPGRGLRGVKNIEIQRHASSEPWVVSAALQTEFGLVQLGTGLDAKTEKRIVRVQGQTMRSQNALAEHLACVWLTPQMDRLFLDSAAHRRRFLDRLIFAFDPGHAGRVTRYENAMRQRSKILQDAHRSGKRPDASWLTGLEAQMAETAVAIAAAKAEFVQRLQAVCDTHESPHFPKAWLSARGTLEELLSHASALEVEELFKYQLLESREIDKITGGAATGPHKSDLSVFYAAKDIAADQCSTGEQKALLIGILLAHARLVKAERGQSPILLLDEVAAHLDEARRAALYDVLEELDAQVWLTGTDRSLFKALEGRGQFFRVENSEIHTK